MFPFTLIRGGGDLASGVALRLHRVGLGVVITELPQPLAVRRLVAFSEAVYDWETRVEEVTARRVESAEEIPAALEQGIIPVLVDPRAALLEQEVPGCRLAALVDARMTKQPPDLNLNAAPLIVGLGPGFVAGLTCHAVIETRRGHTLGRVYWQGGALADSRLPEGDPRRVLRAPQAGRLTTHRSIGDHCDAGDRIASIGEAEIRAPFAGVLRGLLRDGMDVTAGMKIGDLDPRDDPALCRLVSEKSLAVGGGVLEALLTRPDIRKALWP